MIKQFLFAGALFAGISMAQSNNYVLDKSHSHVNFEITHLSISTVDGSFRDFQGTVVWDEKDPSKSKFDVTIQSKSVFTDDDKRDEHLRTDGFFDVVQFPTIHFVSKQVIAKGGAFVAIGELTLPGVTKTVEIPFKSAGPAVDPWKNIRRSFSGTFTIKRSDFHLGDSFPAAMVGDEVEIRISSEGIQQK